MKHLLKNGNSALKSGFPINKFLKKLTYDYVFVFAFSSDVLNIILPFPRPWKLSAG